MLRNKNKIEPQIVKRRLEDEAEPFEALIGVGITLDGTLSGRKTVGIAGYIKGDIDIQGLVWVLPGGRIQGRVNAGGVIIEGEIKGEIRAADKVEIRSPGRLRGDVTCSRVAIAEGAFFEGEVKMRTKDGRPVSFVEKRTKP